MVQNLVIVRFQNAEVRVVVDVGQGRSTQKLRLPSVMELLLRRKQAVLDATQRCTAPQVAENRGTQQIPGVEFLGVKPAAVFTGRLILRDADKRLARKHIAQLREHRDSLRLHGGDVAMLKGGTSSSYTVSAVFYWP